MDTISTAVADEYRAREHDLTESEAEELAAYDLQASWESRHDTRDDLE